MKAKHFATQLRACALVLGVWLGGQVTHAATTVDIPTNVVVTAAKRMGINLGFHTYYDSRLIMKELAFRNPGFEGQQYQSVVRVASGTATSCVDDTAFGGWTNGFWDGASYEFVWGAARGRTGTVAGYTRPPSQTTGSGYNFADSSTTPAAGDYFVLRKVWNTAPETGWTTSGTNFAITPELADLPPDTAGRQALHVASTSSPANFSLTANADTYPGQNFLLLNGRFRVTFKAKSRAGTQALNVVVRRTATYLNTNVTLTAAWTTYALDFNAAEVGSAPGGLSLQFNLYTAFDALLDDVSFTQVDSDAGNPTAYRDAVVNALKLYRPGILRGWQEPHGESLDNQLAPPLGRRRAGFTLYGTAQANLQYGWHEFLELCEHVGAEPWLVVPITFSTQEMAGLIEYLTGPTNTPYGARRAARGHPAPWTDVLPKIHLEFGNEAWNGFTYFGGVMTQSVPYGNRAGELFATARAATGFVSNKFDLVLGAHAPETVRNLNIHNACTNHDSLTVDGYFYTRVDSFANNEELFSPLLAQPEEFVRAGYMLTNYLNLRASSRPVALSSYEGNLNTTQGAITNSQAALDTLTPSLGVGLAVSHDLLLKLRHLAMRDQCLFSLGGYTTSIGSGSRIWGVTRDMGVSDRKRPQFLALQLINDAIGAGADVLQTSHTGDDPTWSAAGTNSLSLTTAHYISSYALAGGTNRALIVFNLHRSSALDVNFSGSNAPSGAVTLKRLTSANITDNNEDSLNVAPTTNTFSNFNPAANISLPPFSMNVFEWSTAAPVTAPAITAQPQGQVVIAGTNVTLSVTATGTAPLTYQWQRNSVNLPGATGPTLALTSVTRATTGAYVVQVSNPGGATASQPATVRVLNYPRLQPPQPLAGGGLRLLFNDHDGGALSLGDSLNFEIFVSTNLLATNWARLNLPLTVTNGMLSLDDSDTLSQRHRFYRVIER
ncbi:MAG: immunoglobulin domain-containing protein [Verrucomicrobia bacterium]|nr:immunoglobulin domain-containing protein [Verrucomicrobiota bacterium]